jgi:hypothetical protein
LYCIRNRVDPQKYTVLKYRLSVFRPQIQGCNTAVILFPSLATKLAWNTLIAKVVKNTLCLRLAHSTVSRENRHTIPRDRDTIPL